MLCVRANQLGARNADGGLAVRVAVAVATAVFAVFEFAKATLAAVVAVAVELTSTVAIFANVTIAEVFILRPLIDTRSLHSRCGSCGVRPLGSRYARTGFHWLA